MISSLQSRLRTASLDQLALLAVAIGFVLLALFGLLNGHGALYFLTGFLEPIIRPSFGGYGIVEILFVLALALSAIAALRRSMRIWRAPAIAAGEAIPTSLSWRERAAWAAAVLGERRGPKDAEEPGPTESQEPATPLLLGSGPDIADNDAVKSDDTTGGWSS